MLDRAGRPLAAIALTLRTPDAGPEHVAELVGRARLAADDIARRLSPNAKAPRRPPPPGPGVS